GSAGSSQDAIFNIKSTTDHPSSYLLAHFIIIYDGGPKNSLLEKRKALFEKTYLNELKEATIEYFRSQSYADLQEEDAMQSARESLVKIYNDIVTGKTNQKIVLKIIFDKWIIQ
ncbi:MAG: flagellar basal body-associated FliL family protein, partial [Clostridia bacterium]|nr:flagellar basal body-associated FliL family protein [Clostridia bacterium]